MILDQAHSIVEPQQSLSFAALSQDLESHSKRSMSFGNPAGGLEKFGQMNNLEEAMQMFGRSARGLQPTISQRFSLDVETSPLIDFRSQQHMGFDRQPLAFLSEAVVPTLSDRISAPFSITNTSLERAWQNTSPVSDCFSPSVLQLKVVEPATFHDKLGHPSILDGYASISEVQSSDRLLPRHIDAENLAATFATARPMSLPWGTVGRDVRSVQTFSDMMALGRSDLERSIFDTDVSHTLGFELGGLRDIVAETAGWREAMTRLAYYRERGLDSASPHLTFAALDKTMRLGNLREQLFCIRSERRNSDTSARSLQAYDVLSKLEHAVRRFIVEEVAKKFGKDWVRTQIPEVIRSDWLAKRDKAVCAGQPTCPLIDYADFTHYKIIIERRDNWEHVFKRFFGRMEDVRESFQRLFPIRVATMHTRPLTDDDMDVLLVESRRLLKAIRA